MGGIIVVGRSGSRIMYDSIPTSTERGELVGMFVPHVTGQTQDVPDTGKLLPIKVAVKA